MQTKPPQLLEPCSLYPLLPTSEEYDNYLHLLTATIARSKDIPHPNLNPSKKRKFQDISETFEESKRQKQDPLNRTGSQPGDTEEDVLMTSCLEHKD